MANENTKRITLDIPEELFRRFEQSELMRNCSTFAEGLRTAMRKVLDQEGESQGKNGGDSQCS